LHDYREKERWLVNHILAVAGLLVERLFPVLFVKQQKHYD
jgi:hypothetical protein